MLDKILSSDFFIKYSDKFNTMLDNAEQYIRETDNIKIVSFSLMTLAGVLFLSLIIIIYIRNIIYFVKSNNPKEDQEEREDNYIVLSAEDANLELERELQKELEMAQAEKQARELAEQEEEEKRLAAELLEAEEKMKEKKKEEKEFRNQENTNKTQRQKNNKEKKGIDLDWQKGKIPPANDMENTMVTQSISTTYQQSRKELQDLLGLLLDMLGRGVDDLKIAQTLNYKMQGMGEESDIIKSIDAVKIFISLCVSGKFTQLEKFAELPGEEQALYNLANGDPSLALALLECLMDSSIDKANGSASEEKRQQLYQEVSVYACCFGALAELNDIMLATSSYELAIELQSSNVVAWNRLGDVYRKASSLPKAAWAYQNVLNFADGEIDALEVANANKHLSEHLYAEGNSIQAAKLYNSSKQYYDSLGINRRLDRQEIDIISIIEENQASSISETIAKLLSPENVR